MAHPDPGRKPASGGSLDSPGFGGRARSVGAMKDVVMRLPDGTTVKSVVLTDEQPPRHVYRLLTPTGTATRDFATLAQLAAFLEMRP